MTSAIYYGPPLAALIFLLAFGTTIIFVQARSKNEKGGDTKDHSERIYKDFEMYLKVMLGIVAAFGYIRLEAFDKQTEIARQALNMLGALSLFVMTMFGIFILCHQGSKVRRWENIEWGKLIFWQELWACLGMWLFSSALWVISFVW